MAPDPQPNNLWIDFESNPKLAGQLGRVRPGETLDLHIKARVIDSGPTGLNAAIESVMSPSMEEPGNNAETPEPNLSEEPIAIIVDRAKRR